MANKTKAVQRSLKYLRERGWNAAVVERWLPPRGNMKFGVRQDVWGCGDILACNPETHQIALIQCFPMSRWKDHVVTCEVIPELRDWLKAGGEFYLHGWALKPKDGIRGAKKVWSLREQAL